MWFSIIPGNYDQSLTNKSDCIGSDPLDRFLLLQSTVSVSQHSHLTHTVHVDTSCSFSASLYSVPGDFKRQLNRLSIFSCLWNRKKENEIDLSGSLMDITTSRKGIKSSSIACRDC